jgi:tetratricopeptide (TPR) repeat protein
LKKAAKYGEKAFVILSEHGTSLSDYNSILSQVFQWLGVVYGELSLEVVKREDRTRHQEEAIIMLSKARSLQKTNHRARYQLALQFAEVGEVRLFFLVNFFNFLFHFQFQQAVDEINRAITLDSTVPSYYNLLVLMLSSKSHVDKALALGNAGWSHCLKHLCTIHKVDSESELAWDSVNPSYRDDLVKCVFLTFGFALLY